ncbi:MAG: GDP-mannose 4,6-dehydratase [Candidatus Omnitrophica bacterium]|nr:GDP-mannose 4,6-dehydratase [Candidatus Omnitrophota bacterium]
MKVFITGGAGFIGSHVAEYYAQRGEQVVIYDNLSRLALMGKMDSPYLHNWDYLSKYAHLKRVRADILDMDTLKAEMKGADVVVHTAGQTAVTTSYQDPLLDFRVNALGTLHVLEAARMQSKAPAIVYCSTNKVYGTHVNQIAIEETPTRYQFSDPNFKLGIPETFDIDHCERSPYGCSKLAGDLYMQDYASHLGLKIGIFRMSCIYGPRQMGVEDQGWLAWFSIAAFRGDPVTFYGNGKQVRDVLFVSDLVKAFDAFVCRAKTSDIFNMGGGPRNVLSLIELCGLLKQMLGKESRRLYEDWRPNDQKVYISDIRKAREVLGWEPRTAPDEGVAELVEWVRKNQTLFSSPPLISA